MIFFSKCGKKNKLPINPIKNKPKRSLCFFRETVSKKREKKYFFFKRLSFVPVSEKKKYVK